MNLNNSYDDFPYIADNRPIKINVLQNNKFLGKLSSSNGFCEYRNN